MQIYSHAVQVHREKSEDVFQFDLSLRLNFNGSQSFLAALYTAAPSVYSSRHPPRASADPPLEATFSANVNSSIYLFKLACKTTFKKKPKNKKQTPALSHLSPKEAVWKANVAA